MHECHLDVKVLKVVRDAVVQVCTIRPLDGARSSHEHVVQHGASGLLGKGIKPSRRHNIYVQPVSSFGRPSRP